MHLVIETPRLNIVNFTSSDTNILYQLTGDKEVMRFFPKVLTYEETEQMVHKILDDYKKYGHCFWKALSKADEDFMGIVGLLHQELDGEVETEISYRITRKHWNNGYATEAARACKVYGKNILGKRRLISLIHPQNAASIRVAEKLGAKKSRTVLFIGEEHEVYVY